MLRPFPRCAHNGVGLVAILRCEPAVRGHHVAERMNFLMVACRVCGDFRRLFSVTAGALQILSYLLATRTRCVKILLGVALDLRRAASTSGDFIAKLSQPVGQLRLIDGRGKLLRSEEALRLKGAVLAVLALGDVEDDRVGVELWSGVALHGPGGVMLELRRYEFSRGFRRMVPANSGHSVM